MQIHSSAFAGNVGRKRRNNLTFDTKPIDYSLRLEFFMLPASLAIAMVIFPIQEQIRE